MEDLSFLLTEGVLPGTALAVDAVCVSVADGLSRPDMNSKRMFSIALVFGGFQFAMPLAGRLVAMFMTQTFSGLMKYMPWVSAAVFLYLAFQMFREYFSNESEGSVENLFLQGIATSIDAFAAGFSLYNLNFENSFFCSLIIGAVTFVLCVAAVFSSSRLGSLLSRFSRLFGGIIFIILAFKQVLWP